MSEEPTRSGMSRRQALAGAVAAAGLTIAGRPVPVGGTTLLAGAKVCVLTPEGTQGPFYFDPKLVRTDITEGKQGAPLDLTLQVVEAETCAKLGGARVDVWHSDGLGVYSGYARQATGSTEGETFLRGTQFADADGQVRFATIYPGWYPGRTPHIHFKVLIDDKDFVTGQLYFPDEVSDRIDAGLEPYLERTAKRETFNSNDFIFQRQAGTETLVAAEEERGRYRATLVIGVDRGGAKRT